MSGRLGRRLFLGASLVAGLLLLLTVTVLPGIAERSFNRVITVKLPSVSSQAQAIHDGLFVADLVEYLEQGCKPASQWRLGTEHEKFGFTVDDLRPLPYEGERGIRSILVGLAEQFDWQLGHPHVAHRAADRQFFEFIPV